MVESILEIFVFAIVIATAFGLIFWAWRATKGDRSAVVGLYLVFGLPGGLLTIAGAALLVNGASGGWLALGIGLGLLLPMIRQFRVALAKVTPMDPNSPIDFSGLAIILAIAAYLIYALVFLPPEDTGQTAISAGQNITSLIVNVVAFVALAYVAVGYRIYRTGKDATERLGLRRPTLESVAVGVAAVVPAFVFSITASLLTQHFQPGAFDRLDKTVSEMTTGVQNPAGALLLGLSAGIGEEVLFRGAIQPRFGIVIAALFWSLLHVQYELTWVIAGLFAMGIMLGLIRNRWGTTAAIITHAVFNVIAVLLGSLG